MSVLVPVLPCRVLAVETPVSGDPAEAHEAEARLNRVSGHLQHLVDATRSATPSRLNRSLTIERVELVLSERVQRRSRLPLQCLGAKQLKRFVLTASRSKVSTRKLERLKTG